MSNSKRLDYVLVHAGIGSRKTVKGLVRKSDVLVNGVRVRDSSIHVKFGDTISVDGEEIEFKEFYYFMMNKPPGVVSATTDPREKTVLDLLSESDQKKSLFPVGRLDKDTEGLIFLTTDGKLAHTLLSPNNFKIKSYIAQVSTEISKADIAFFRKGIILDDGYKTAPARLEIIEDNLHKCSIDLTEGKFHQIKRMFEAIGKEVIKLKRLSIDSLNLDESLHPGEYRELTEEEIVKLKGIE